jgi:thioester reductase-like protein
VHYLMVLSSRLLLNTCTYTHAGYAQSKWMAEHIVLQAGELGVPVTILRLPFVSGHTNTGTCIRS